MAYVQIPKDLTKVKTKLMLGLTKRQIVCFGTAALIGVPVFFATRGALGNSTAILLMMGLMLPAFFMAMYEKDGQPAERILFNILRCRWFFPPKRPYKTENFYSIIEKEGRIFDSTEQPQDQKATKSRKTAGAKRATATGK
ncbi:MAG: PrgI family protein [Oscillospiraceae bacterium]|nr:PrgI family protein [Oscillospiraceae bacterium]